MSEKLLTIKEAATLKNIPISTIKAYCQSGKFPNAKLEESPVGKYWLIPISDLELVEYKKRGRPKKADEKTDGEKGK